MPALPFFFFLLIVDDVLFYCMLSLPCSCYFPFIVYCALLFYFPPLLYDHLPCIVCRAMLFCSLLCYVLGVVLLLIDFLLYRCHYIWISSLIIHLPFVISTMFFYSVICSIICDPLFFLRIIVGDILFHCMMPISLFLLCYVIILSCRLLSFASLFYAILCLPCIVCCAMLCAPCLLHVLCFVLLHANSLLSLCCCIWISSLVICSPVLPSCMLFRAAFICVLDVYVLLSQCNLCYCMLLYSAAHLSHIVS